MDSKRLFTVIALWLILSCVLFEYAEGWVRAGKRRRRRRRKSPSLTDYNEKTVTDLNEEHDVVIDSRVCTISCFKIDLKPLKCVCR